MRQTFFFPPSARIATSKWEMSYTFHALANGTTWSMSRSLAWVQVSLSYGEYHVPLVALQESSCTTSVPSRFRIVSRVVHLLCSWVHFDDIGCPCIPISGNPVREQIPVITILGSGTHGQFGKLRRRCWDRGNTRWGRQGEGEDNDSNEFGHGWWAVATGERRAFIYIALTWIMHGILSLKQVKLNNIQLITY